MRLIRSRDLFRREEQTLNLGTKFAMAGATAMAISTSLVTTASSAVAAGHTQIKHVLLISVDGMHQSDLDWYVANHPSSTLAKLTHTGSEYTNAAASNPSAPT